MSFLFKSINCTFLSMFKNSTLFRTSFPFVKTTPKVRGCGTFEMSRETARSVIYYYLQKW